jgi:hypothetical protein
MAIYMAIVNGTTLLGSPFVGWIANRWGARWALMVGATAGLVAALVGMRLLVRHLEGRPLGKAAYRSDPGVP